jgi:protein TonB
MARSGLRSHLSGTLPISIAVHLVALLAIFVVPLVANVVVPTISETPRDWIPVAPMPPPPPVVLQPRPASSGPNPAPHSGPPTEAPDKISEEKLSAPDAYVPGPLGATSGINIEGALPIGPVVAVPPPPEPPKPAGPVRVADLPVPPHKIVDVRPIYPEPARAARIEGLVVMEAVLDPTGHVTQLRVIRSVPLLDQAAMNAVRQWRYTPTMYYGKPVSVLMTITINFTLQ